MKSLMIDIETRESVFKSHSFSFLINQESDS